MNNQHLSQPKPHWLNRFLPTPGNIIFTLLAITLAFWAQSVGALPGASPTLPPQQASTDTIPYQGRLTDNDGNPLTGNYPMTFRLYDASTGGTLLWEEQWSAGVQVADGLFNVMLGSIDNTLGGAIAGYDELYLGITVGTDGEISPRVQLGSVPFAMQASDADTVDGLHASDLATNSTMVEGWPDAIKCYSSSQNLNTILYLTYDSSWQGNRMHYRQINYVDRIEVSFNLDGTFYDEHYLNNSDCHGKSITQLYAEGKAFNFVGRDLGVSTR